MVRPLGQGAPGRVLDVGMDRQDLMAWLLFAAFSIYGVAMAVAERDTILTVLKAPKTHDPLSGCAVVFTGPDGSKTCRVTRHLDWRFHEEGILSSR
jgi:hypothetical protein